MTDPNLLLANGDLDGTRAALVEIVRAKPQDPQARMFLFQLFAVLGEWDKARLQLNTLAQLSPEAQMLSVAYGQALEAEKQRAAALAGQQAVPVHGSAPDWTHRLAEAIGLLAQGSTEAGLELRDAAFDEAPVTPGEVDGQAFEWIANADARFGPTLEAIIGGRWGLLPFEIIERIESAGVRDLRDTVWYPAEIALKSGQSVAALLPARYAGTEQNGTPQEKLVRATNWVDTPSGSQGIGQQILTLSGGEDFGLLSIRTLVFE